MRKIRARFVGVSIKNIQLFLALAPEVEQRYILHSAIKKPEHSGKAITLGNLI